MPTLIITGANRGLGLEFAKQYAADGWTIIATARRSSPELDALGVRVETLDMVDLDAVAGFGERIDQPIDLLIANAGSMQPPEARSTEEGRRWVELLTVNSIAPYLLAKALTPAVAKAKGKMIAISSQMGSIADSSGGYVPYRTSKAALNMAWNALAKEVRSQGIAAAVLNPGWVRTDMGGPNASISPDESIGNMRKVIDGLDLNRSGSFIDRDGSELPW